MGSSPLSPRETAIWGTSGRGHSGWHALPVQGQGKHPPEAQLGRAPAERAGAQSEEVSAFRPLLGHPPFSESCRPPAGLQPDGSLQLLSQEGDSSGL